MPSHLTYFKIGNVVQYDPFNYEYIIKVDIEKQIFDSVYQENLMDPMSSNIDYEFKFITDIFYV